MHHALVVKVINDYQLLVIHNNGQNVAEDVITMEARFITAVVYECAAYSGNEAIARARKRLGDGTIVSTS